MEMQRKEGENKGKHKKAWKNRENRENRENRDFSMNALTTTTASVTTTDITATATMNSNKYKKNNTPCERNNATSTSFHPYSYLGISALIVSNFLSKQTSSEPVSVKALT